jgi:hypothetical protein
MSWWGNVAGAERTFRTLGEPHRRDQIWVGGVDRPGAARGQDCFIAGLEGLKKGGPEAVETVFPQTPWP